MENFMFNEKKAAQAAKLLINLTDDKIIDHFLLQKLLYIIDREAIKRFNFPVCGGNYISMFNGPLISQTKDCVRFNNEYWCQLIHKTEFFGAERYDLYADEISDIEELEDLNMDEYELICEVFSKFKKVLHESCIDPNFNKFKNPIVNYAHSFKEWEKQRNVRDVSPIKIETMLKVLNKTENDINEIQNELQFKQDIEKVFI